MQSMNSLLLFVNNTNQQDTNSVKYHKLVPIKARQSLIGVGDCDSVNLLPEFLFSRVVVDGERLDETVQRHKNARNVPSKLIVFTKSGGIDRLRNLARKRLEVLNQVRIRGEQSIINSMQQRHCNA